MRKAVGLFLDLEGNHSWDEIAREISISTTQLSTLVKSNELTEIYNEHFIELGHDPRLRTSQAALVDLLPLAIRRLKEMIFDRGTPPTVLLNAIKDVIRLNNLDSGKRSKDDGAELAEFLKSA